MRLPDPTATYNYVAERERNRVLELADFENVKLAKFNDALIYADRNGLLPAYDVTHFGAKLDGVTDDSVAVLSCIAKAIADGRDVLIPRGTLLLSSAITDTAGRLTIRFEGSPTIKWNGANNTWVFDFIQQRSKLLGYFLLTPYSVSNEYLFNGIRCSGSGSRCVVSGFPQIYKSKNAVKMTTVYGCEFEIDISQASDIGVDFDAESNANTVWAMGITGKTSTYGTTGIRNNGSMNICKSQQLSEWTTAYHGTANSSATMLGHFVESNTTACKLDDFASVVWDCGNANAALDINTKATLITPYGRNHPSGLAHVPDRMLPTRNMSVFYPLQDAGTTIAEDTSGNGRTGTKNGAWIKSTGPYGYALKLASGAYNTIRVPVSAITYNDDWAIAIQVKHESWGTGNQNIVFSVVEGSNTIVVKAEKDTLNTPVSRNGSSLNLSGPLHTTDVWEWICIGYEPGGSGLISQLHPATFTQTVGMESAFANTLTNTPTTIEIGGSSNGTMHIGSVAIWSGRMPSKTEMLHWCNQVIPPTIHASVITLGGNETTGATSVADGGTISHGLGTAPSLVLCSPSVAGEFVSVTAIGATTFTVAIKKHTNTYGSGGIVSGTTQTIYWRALR
jgi:hypothetical protein